MPNGQPLPQLQGMVNDAMAVSSVHLACMLGGHYIDNIICKYIPTHENTQIYTLYSHIYTHIHTYIYIYTPPHIHTHAYICTIHMARIYILIPTYCIMCINVHNCNAVI